MKVWSLLFALTPLVAATWSPSNPSPTTVIIGGEFRGYLSPCGCSEPMQGGISRLSGLVSATRQSGKTLVLLNGAITQSVGRQSELKVEAVSEAVRAMQSSGFNLTSDDAKLGIGTLSAMQRLSGGKLVSSVLRESPGRVAGPFWITGASNRAREIGASLEVEPSSLSASIAQAGSRPVIVLLEGDLSEARRIARLHAQVRLIVYSAPGKAASSPQKQGNAWLVYPGERGTSALRLVWKNSQWISYQAVPLGPEIPGETTVERVFHNYLTRVDQEDLFSEMPRSSGPDYAGNTLCTSCHSKAGDIWKGSKHAEALATLEREGHDRDPDCISCHVVDVHKTTGFRSRKETPELANVGCESCHGPGKDHAMQPAVHKMIKIGKESCMKCHTVNNSPRFEYEAYWKKIAH